MAKDSRDTSKESSEFLGAGGFDPIEVVIRGRVRGFIEELVEAELDDALGRLRYQRPGIADMPRPRAGYRHGRRERQLLGSFGPVTISVPRARLNKTDGTGQEWHSEALPRYARMTKQVPVRHQHAPGTAGSGSVVQGCGVEGHGEPDLAEGAGGLGGMEQALAG